MSVKGAYLQSRDFERNKFNKSNIVEDDFNFLSDKSSGANFYVS